MEYDPPVADASELKTVEVKPTAFNKSPYVIQAEPARKLKHLQRIPIAITTAEASYHCPYDSGSVAFLRQAGCSVEHIELEKLGIRGNAHFVMMERNNREALQPILDFIDAKIVPYATTKIAARPAAASRRSDSTAMTLADIGSFWVGIEPKKLAYGTVPGAPTFVQYLIPREVRHPLPVVLVHGGTGQMLHYMGSGDGAGGWAQYFVQAGYQVYLIDRPGHGRCVYHPDLLGPVGPMATYEDVIARNFVGLDGPDKQWPGTARMGDPLIDQFMASQNSTTQDQALAQSLWAKHGAELLAKLGPSLVMTHSAGGPWGWLVANERPALVKGLVSFEGGGAPLVQQNPRTLNLAGIPMLYVTAENSGRTQGPAIVEALNRSGARAEHLNLRDRGIRGNSHFAMFENNRKQVFDVCRAWLDGIR
jgi:pimeloyl-ACP methyl ester carboxylesterase